MIKIKDEKKEFAVSKIDQILIAAGSSISTDAIKLALQNEIDIVFLILLERNHINDLKDKLFVSNTKYILVLQEVI